MDELKPGDVVRLRCGSPRMVIARADEPAPTMPGVQDWSGVKFHPGCWLVYWTVQGALRQAVFPAEVLELVEDAPAHGVCGRTKD